MPAIVLPPDASSDMTALAARVTKLEATPIGNPVGLTVPGTLATLTLSTTPERDPKTGNDVASITATWTAPTDANPVAYYNIRFSYDGGTTWSAIDQVYGLTTIIHNLFLNKSVTVGVRAVSTTGVQGPEKTNAITTSFDVTAPNTPSTPTGSAGSLQFTAIWDGKDSGGVLELTNAPDLAAIQVHASQSSGFTPAAATLFGTIVSLSGGSFTSLTTASGIWYIKFVAVDKTGNASAGSVQFQVTVLPAAVTSTSVGTIRNTEASMFQTPVTPGGLLVQTNATSNTDTTAFDGHNIGSGTVGAGSSVVKSTVYTGLQPGQYRATFYVKVGTAAGSSATNVVALNIVPHAGVSCNAQTITGAAFAANGTYYGITMPLFVTAASASVELLMQQGSSLTAWNVSHVTIDTANDNPSEFIRAASIVDAKIANMSADKIIAGTVTATVGIGTLGILRAGTAGAARVDTTSAGINAFNGSNAVTFTVDSATGNVTVIGGTITGGIIRTAASGLRWELNSAAGQDKLFGYTGDVAETNPALIRTVVTSALPARQAEVSIASPIISGSSGITLSLNSESADATIKSGFTLIGTSGTDSIQWIGKVGGNNDINAGTGGTIRLIAGLQTITWDGTTFAVPGIVAATGDVSAVGASLPRGRRASGSTTSSTTLITTTETVATGLSAVTWSPNPTSRRYLITVRCYIQSTVSGDEVTLRVRDGLGSAPTSSSTLLDTQFGTVGTLNRGFPMTWSFEAVLGATTHTLGVFGVRSLGTGNCTIGCTVAASPAYITVQDLGT